MINYKVEYTVGQEPHLCKEVILADGSEVCTHLTPANKDELENFTNEQILEHVDNLLAHVKDLTQEMAVVPENEMYRHLIPIVNFREVETSLQKVVQWLEIGLYRNDDPATMHDHTHEGEATV